MKDYSKVKYVKPSVDCQDIIKDKVYEFEYFFNGVGYVIKNDGKYREIVINIPECHQLNGKWWIPCDKDGNEIEI